MGVGWPGAEMPKAASAGIEFGNVAGDEAGVDLGRAREWGRRRGVPVTWISEAGV